MEKSNASCMSQSVKLTHKMHLKRIFHTIMSTALKKFIQTLINLYIYICWLQLKKQATSYEEQISLHIDTDRANPGLSSTQYREMVVVVVGIRHP